MILYTLLLIIVLGILSAAQRIVPWVLYRRFAGDWNLQKIFDLVAVSAFASLMVDNIQAFNVQSVGPLLPALVVAYRTRSLGATVLAALLFSLLLSYIPVSSFL